MNETDRSSFIIHHSSLSQDEHPPLGFLVATFQRRPPGEDLSREDDDERRRRLALDLVGPRVPAGHGTAAARDRPFVVQVGQPVVGKGLGVNGARGGGRRGEGPGRQGSRPARA